MRSFAGVLQTGGAPPEVTRLASHLRLPTSSAPAVWSDGVCALAMVSHRDGRAPEIPAVAGDIRFMAKHEDEDDFELLLRAWRRWGTGCLAHLDGEFSFALWDGGRRELFCARDRFGVRPFYYSRTGDALVFSDSLDAILAHPSMRFDPLDERAVADYLTSGVYEDAEATVYAHVRRLPAAHFLTCAPGGAPRIERYWTPRVGDERPDGDARERLQSALQDAVRDRITGSRAVVFMSGGLDSTALAAMAREIRPDTELLAATSVYRARVPDVEEAFAVEAARSIGIPIRLFPLDDYAPLDSLARGLWTADPCALLTLSMTRDVYALAAEHAAIAMHGHPADAVLAADLSAYLRDLARRRRWAALASALIRYMMVKRRPPYFFLRHLLGKARPISRPVPPAWLRSPVRQRDASPESLAVRALTAPAWSSYFEWAHPLQTCAAIEVTYPWCDARVIDAALSMRPIPWLVDKHVLREVLRNRVSETIRRRVKTFLRGNPWRVALESDSPPVLEAASAYVDPALFRQECRATGALDDAALRAVAFDYWLREMPNRIAALRSVV